MVKDTKEPKVVKDTKDVKSSTDSISDDFNINIDSDDKLLDPTYNTRYKIIDVKGDGSCFYRAIFLILKNQKNIMNFVKCFNQRSGLKETITEDEFVNWIRIKTLSVKTLTGKDNDISKSTYTYLNNLNTTEYKTQIESTWNLDNLKYNKPKTLKEFRTIISEYIANINKYANQYDKDLIETFTEGIFNINVLQMLPELDYDFKANNLYILRVNNNHYKAILLI